METESMNRVMDALELLYVENLARRTILKTYSGQCLPPQYQIDQLVEDAKKDPKVAGVVHE